MEATHNIRMQPAAGLNVGSRYIYISGFIMNALDLGCTVSKIGEDHYNVVPPVGPLDSADRARLEQFLRTAGDMSLLFGTPPSAASVDEVTSVQHQ